MKKKPISTAQRLALQFSLLIAAIIIILSVSFVLVLRQHIRSGQKRELIAAVQQVESKLSERNDRMENFRHEDMNRQDKPPAPHDMVPMAGRGPMKGDLPYYISFTIYNTETEEVLQSNDPFLPVLPETNGKCVRYRKKDYYTDGDLDILYTAQPFVNEVRSYTIQTAMSLDRDTSENLLRSLPVVLLFLFIPFLLISYFASLLITQSTMRYVKQMTAAAAKIGSESLNERLPVKGRGDELDTLADTFNDLFARLKADFDRERRFTSDVSHELKTPLAVILGHANLIRRWGKNDPHQLEQSLGMLINEVHSMETIINNLLQISRLENRKITADIEKNEILPLFERLEQDTTAWSPETVFEIKCRSGLTAFFDPELLYQAFTIVVSNSIKFSEGPLELSLDASKEKSCVRIVVADNGPGIEEDVLPHIFERFYRGDPSHNRDKGGSGLGLSIVKVIMDVMGGSVTALSKAGEGTSLLFIIPA